MVRLQRDKWSLSSWTLRASDYPKPDMHFFPLFLCNFLLCEALEWAVATPRLNRSQWVYISPLPAFLAVKASTSPSAQFLDISYLLWSASWKHETKTQGDDHSLCRSGAKCWRLRFWPPRYFLQHWTCCDVSSLHEALQPTVHSVSLVCNGFPFFFFWYFLICLSVWERSGD